MRGKDRSNPVAAIHSMDRRGRKGVKRMDQHRARKGHRKGHRGKGR